MISKEVTIQLKDGLYERPVAMFVQLASKYESRLMIEYETARINAKSIMGMMTLGMKDGRTILVQADGPDEEEAMSGIVDFLTAGTESALD